MKHLHRKNQTTLRHKKLIIFGVVGLVVTGQLVFDVYSAWAAHNYGDDTIITQLIVNAVNGLQYPAPVEAATGKVYFPDVKLMLPAPSQFDQLRYRNVGTASQPELDITTTAILGQAEAKLWSAQSIHTDRGRQLSAVFDQVPNLQACARGVQVFFDAKPVDNSSVVLQASQVLQNGRAMYIYTEPTCHQDLKTLTEYVKQIQSY